MKCRQCGKRFSNRRHVCPFCGAPAPPRASSKGRWVVNIIVLSLIGFIFWAGIKNHEADIGTKTSEIKTPVRQEIAKKPKEPRENIADDLFEVGKYITKVGVDPLEAGYSVAAVISPESVRNTETYFETVGDDMLNTAKVLVKKHGDEVNEIVYFFHGPMVDKYGNGSIGLFMNLRYPMDEVRKINWDNMSYERFLNLAVDGTFEDVGKQVLYAYCKADEDWKSRTFCYNFLPELLFLKLVTD